MENENKTEKTILVVDDEDALLLSLQRPLKTRYKVLATNRSVDVMNILRIESVNCILLDIRMPGMTGIELLKEIKFTYPHMAVLIMTGHGDESDAITALKYGAAGFIKKPIDIYVLFDEIERVTSLLTKSYDAEKPPEILLLDDDSAFLTSVERHLRTYNYQVSTACTVEDALAMIAKKKFDIIVVDMLLPGMNGLQFIDEAKKTYSEMIFIVVTGNSSQELAIDAIKHGVFDYIRKPLDMGDLVSSIERSINKLRVNREIHHKNQELTAKETILQKLNDEIVLQKDFLENIVKSISNMLIVTNESGGIRSLNDATLKTLGYDASELIDKPLSVVFQVGDLAGFMSDLVRNKGISNFECKYLAKDTQKVYVLLSGSMIRNSAGGIEGFVFVAQDISKHKAAEERLHQLSYYDALTTLPNRLYFEIKAKQALDVATKDNKKLAFLYLDLDGFKAVNDRLGHPVGDALLKEVAQRLNGCFRANDFIARIGGDEFVAVVNNAIEKSDSAIVAQRLISAVNRPYYIDDNEISVGVSIGIATYPDTASSFNQLFKNADVALYKAKHAGRNQYQYFSRQLDAKYSEQLKMENLLRFALGREEFRIVYQPVFELTTKKIVAVEELIRWKNAELGDVSPEIFIPLAEYMGMIMPIGEYIIDTSFKQFSYWQKKHNIDFRLSLNISGCQLDRDDYLIDFLQKMCTHYDIKPNSIELELTETAIMSNPLQAENTLNELHDLGFMIVIDDFGQGFSSLSLLSRLPVSVLKIDKKFVDKLSDAKNEFIVKSIINLSKNLSLFVIAEGIETKEQLNYLAELGCECGQGYYFCKPSSPEKLIAFLGAQS